MEFCYLEAVFCCLNVSPKWLSSSLPVSSCGVSMSEYPGVVPLLHYCVFFSMPLHWNSINGSSYNSLDVHMIHLHINKIRKWIWGSYSFHMHSLHNTIYERYMYVSCFYENHLNMLLANARVPDLYSWCWTNIVFFSVQWINNWDSPWIIQGPWFSTWNVWTDRCKQLKWLFSQSQNNMCCFCGTRRLIAVFLIHIADPNWNKFAQATHKKTVLHNIYSK